MELNTSENLKLRSLGPLTQAILLIMEDKFFDKLKSAFNNTLQMLPMAPRWAPNCHVTPSRVEETPGQIHTQVTKFKNGTPQ